MKEQRLKDYQGFLVALKGHGLKDYQDYISGASL